MTIGEITFSWNAHHENEEDSMQIEHVTGVTIDLEMTQLEELIRMAAQKINLRMFLDGR